MRYVNRSALETLLDRIGSATECEGTLYLIGETSLVWAGARPWTDEIELAIAPRTGDGDGFEETLTGISADLGVRIIHEAPGDVIPLPAGWEQNCRPTDRRAGAMDVAHFDPYSVSLRSLARGDEEDYRLIVGYLEHGWIEMAEMDRQLEELLPRLSFETIAQDPAEFRRKYRGLQQMAKARGLR